MLETVNITQGFCCVSQLWWHGGYVTSEHVLEHLSPHLPDRGPEAGWTGGVLTCLTGGVLTCLGMFVCLAQVGPVWSCLSKPVESSGVYFTWPTDMFISCLTD